MQTPNPPEAADAAQRYPLHREGLPDFIIRSASYTIRYAHNPEDLEAIQQLRYRVFNLELGEGLESSVASGLDADEYDIHCHHLMVVNEETQAVVGTYRMQTKEMADAGEGFYSSGEYNLDSLPEKVIDRAVEIGRACIDKDHRNGRVLFLLFRGLVKYVVYNQKLFMFGCCSLGSQDPEEGIGLYDKLKDKGHVARDFNLKPQPGYECKMPPMHIHTCPDVKIPRLMRIYFNYAARICSEPAIDRQFKTIDYIALVDIRDMDTRSYQQFTE